MATKKQNTVTTTHAGDLSFDKPAQILSRMKELKDSMSIETDKTKALVICLELNALSKAFTKLLVESFNCSDAVTESIMDSEMLSNEGFTISINNTMYSYTKEEVKEVSIDKTFLTSQGVKTLKAYAEKLEAEGLPIPACIDVSTKTIHSFKPDKWNGEALASEVISNVITIKDKEIKK
jgi:hypothetical protein